MVNTRETEENPFENSEVSKEWINSVENEKGLIRDNEIYPYLKKWVFDLHPKILVEVGAGQGICSEKIKTDAFTTYFGIEPSVFLVERAQFLYDKPNRKFIVGNAYHIPFENEKADGVFSVNVWFHLADINLASYELSRILKLKGKFLIITANPEAYEVWESFYYDHKKEGKRISGKVKVPINPLSSSIFYEHTPYEIKQSLESNSMQILKIDKLGIIDKVQQKLFLAIAGERI